MAWAHQPHGVPPIPSISSEATSFQVFRYAQAVLGLRLCLNCLKVNAMDIIAVHKASQWARQWTLDQKGPVLLEMVTYRYGGHSYVYLARRPATAMLTNNAFFKNV